MAACCHAVRALPRPHAVPSGFEQYASLLASVRWGWRKTACHGCQAPFLDVGFDEDEAALAEVDMHCARAVGADCGKEILGFESMGDIVEFLAVAGEEDSPGSGTVAYADDIALDVFWAIIGGREGLVVAAMAGRGVC